MRCDDARLALSARLDGEGSGQPAEILNAHLDGCALCATWLAGAERVTRTVRVRSVVVPDLTAQILAAVYADGSMPVRPQSRPQSRSLSRPAPVLVIGRWRWTMAQLALGLRWALGILAVGQVMLAVPDLFAVPDILGVVGHEAHAGREVAAFDIALAVGLLLVAWYPEYARVFAPVVITLVVCFASASALDIMQGVVSPTRVAVHAVAVVQAALVWWLARTGHREPVPAV